MRAASPAGGNNANAGFAPGACPSTDRHPSVLVRTVVLLVISALHGR